MLGNNNRAVAEDVIFENEHEFIMLEAINLLKNTIPTSFAAVVFLALIITFVIYPFTHPLLLPTWMLLLLLSFFVRVFLAKKFEYRVKPGGIGLNGWLKCFQFATMLTGIIWAVGEILILYTAQGMQYEHYVFMLFVSVGFFMGALLVLSVDKFTMLLSCVPSLVPLYWCFFAMADSTAFASALAFSLFLFYLYFAAQRHGHSLHENLRLRFAAVEDEKRLKQILNHSPIAVSISGLKSDEKLFANDSFHNMMMPYLNDIALLSSILPPHEYASLIDQLDKQQNISNKLIAIQKKKNESSLKWVLSSFSRFDYQGQPAVLSWFYDITDRKRMEDKVQHLAHHDTLTGLPNRFLFEDRVNKAIQHANRQQSKIGLMYIDLDGFKAVNDAFGHDVGDELLKLVANRMSTEVRETDTVARLGGDEFAVVLDVMDTDRLFDIAEKLRVSIEKEFVISSNPINISCSIGLAVYPDHADSIDTLLINADKAMYKVKQSGRNNIALYQ